MAVIAGAISLIPSVVGAFLSLKLVKKIEMKNIIELGILINVITSAFIYIVSPTNLGKIFFYILFTIGSFFIGLCQPIQGTMMPMAVDYSEWKFRISNTGFLGSINNFFQILSIAIGNGIIGWLLNYVKYEPNVTQTKLTLTGIKLAMSIIPAVIFLLGFIIYLWDLDQENHKKIISELQIFYDKKNS